jgi:hypothetical protein
VGRDGRLSTTPQITVDGGEDANGVVLSPNSRNIYIANTYGVYEYQLSADGLLQPSEIRSIPAGYAPRAIAYLPADPRHPEA